MTLDQCRAMLTAIRGRQGSSCPSVRVDCEGVVYRGRLVASDSDDPTRDDRRSPFGTLVLAPLGLADHPRTCLQIACIEPGGIRDLQPETCEVLEHMLTGAV